MAHICIYIYRYIYGFYRDCIPIFPIPTTKFDSKSFSSRPASPHRDLMLLYDPMSLKFLMSAHSALIPRP